MRSERRRFGKLTVFAIIVLTATLFVLAQDEPAAGDDGIREKSDMGKTLSSVVQVLTGKGDGLLRRRGAGVIIREDGVILTSYTLVKDASQVQIRLSNGEIFDRVELLNRDERRDVAALKIPGIGLPVVPMADETLVTGETAFVVSNSDGKSWIVTEGLVNAVRLADEIPNAGNGFRVVQFTSALDSSSNGGVVTDKYGRAIGLITILLQAGKRSHHAIPFSSVGGLGEASSDAMAFGSGESLEIPLPARPPSSIDIVNSDPHSILRNAKIFYVYSDSFYIKAQMMENALMRESEFKSGDLKLIDKRDSADILINVEHKLFTWDYRYTLKDRRTGIVLASEKVTVLDGKAASKKFSKKIMAILREHKKPEKKSDKDT